MDTLVLVGGLTDVCIHYTAVDAHQWDYHIRVVADAVAGSCPEAHRADHVDFGRELDGAEGPHCLEDSPGTDFAWLTYPLPGEYRVVKRRYSAFFGTDLEILLRGLHVDTLVLVGGLTDVCIHYTAADAHQWDYHIRVVADAVAGSDPEAHAASLRAIRYLQRDALVTAADVEAAE